jgi:hypothetical protein
MTEIFMKLLFNKTGNEEGSALIVALLFLVLLTIIGISASTTSQIEVNIAANQKTHEMAFNHSDSGIYATPKLISTCIESGAEQAAAGFTYLGAGGTFYREIMGYDPWDAARDTRLTLSGFDVDVDVNRTGVQHLAGGGVEFASGAEGIGVGSAGGVAIFYDMDSLGNGPASSVSDIGGVYRKVVGVPGGL